MSVHPLVAARQHLLADVAVTGRVEDRVFVRRMDIGPGVNAVLLRGVGGAADPDVPVGFPRFEVRAYGMGPEEADALYGLVRASLRRMEHPDVPHVIPETEPVQLDEPDTEWPFALAFWRGAYFEE